jgi:hypothetical protein
VTAPKVRYFNVPLSEAAAAYFESCARVRNVMPGPLIKEMLELVASEVMLTNILDDDGKRRKASERKLGDRGYHERYHKRGQNKQ